MKSWIIVALALAGAVAFFYLGGSGGPQTVRWVDGWEAGRKAAAAKGKPMLVYVGRKTPF